MPHRYDGASVFASLLTMLGSWELRFRLHLGLVKRTAGPSTSLRFGRDDNSSFKSEVLEDDSVFTTELSSRPKRSEVEGPAVNPPLVDSVGDP
jgi:hypothetical protein